MATGGNSVADDAPGEVSRSPTMAMGGNSVADDAPGEVSNTDMTEGEERQVVEEEEACLRRICRCFKICRPFIECRVLYAHTRGGVCVRG